MTKKSFIALADALRQAGHTPGFVVDALVRFCKAQNPRFNEARWRAYLKGECGPNGGTIEPTTKP